MCVGGFENTIVLFIANQRLHFPAHKTAAPRVKYELILNTRELMPPSIKHKSHLELMTSQRNEAMRVRPALHTHYVQVNTCWHFPHHSGGGRGDERGGGRRERGVCRSIPRALSVSACVHPDMHVCGENWSLSCR